MLDFFNSFANTDLQIFPATKAVNSSGGQATDGTEFVANLINDIWGFFQGLLNFSFQSPSGLVEEYNNSQLITALQRFTIPGMVIPVAWNDDPLTLGIRALPLVGQGILRANYADLDNLVYVGDTDNPTASFFYHADDAAGTIRNTAGVYLILPDARGRVIRGLDLTGGVDPDGATRDLGSYQVDTGQLHWHELYTEAGRELKYQAGTDANDSYLAIDDNTQASGGTGVNYIARNLIDAGGGTPRTSSETRMINLALDYIITY